jgi:integrase
LPSGRWQARFKHEGRWHSVGTFGTEKLAGRALARSLGKVEAGEVVHAADGRMTFGEFGEQWLAGRYGDRPSTRASRTSTFRACLVPELGDRPLARITASEVGATLAGLADSGRTAGTVRNARQLAASILDAAVADRRLSRNPARELPRVKASKRASRSRALVVDPAEIAAAAAVIDPRFRHVVLLAGLAGLRIAEIGGLRVGDVDLLGRKLSISRQLVEVRGQLIEGPPKSDAGVRVVPIPAALADELAPLLAGKADDEHVVAGPAGGSSRFRPSVYRRRFWWPAAAAIGRPDLRMHDLRHAAVSLWIRAKYDAKQVQTMAGHESIGITFDLYGHLFPSAVAVEELAALDAIIEASPAPQLAPVVAIR